MIILPCKVKSFNVKEKEIAVSITISDSVLQKNPEAVSELLSLKNANLNLALAPEKKEETFEKELRQLDFEIRCPDCQSYDVRVGEKIGFCVDCKKEFYKFRPDAYFKIEKVEKLRP